MSDKSSTPAAGSAGSSGASGAASKKPLPEQNPAFKMMGMQTSVEVIIAMILTMPLCRSAEIPLAIAKLADLLVRHWVFHRSGSVRQMADEAHAREVV